MVDVGYGLSHRIVYIGSHSGLFTAVDVLSGRRLWETQLPNRIEASASSSQHGDFVLVGEELC